MGNREQETYYKGTNEMRQITSKDRRQGTDAMNRRQWQETGDRLVCNKAPRMGDSGQEREEGRQSVG